MTGGDAAAARDVTTAGSFDADRLDAVARLLGRGMADNPVHAAVYGTDEARSAKAHARLVGALLRASPHLRLDTIERSGAILGVAASALPGRCRSSPAARLRLLGAALGLGPLTARRALTWNRAWAGRDPDEPHVHLGPVAVDRHLRGRGLGGELLGRHVRRLDDDGAVGYLETDRPSAVGFYRRFGYDVVGEGDVLGVRCWYLRRPPAPAASHPAYRADHGTKEAG